MLRLSTPFRGIGYKISKAFPYMKLELRQAEMDFEAEEYAAIMSLSFVMYLILLTGFSWVMLSRFRPQKFIVGGFKVPEAIPIAITIGLIGAFLIFIQMSMYPNLQIKKKIRGIESNLVFALRTMLVQIKSGISLFAALDMIAKGGFGQLSKEFGKAVDMINTGSSQTVALQNIATNNPSPYVRKVIWQVVNGMKAGGDISDILSESVSSMTREQEIEIQRYGNSLRVLSLMYLMVGIIMPALGITFLIVLGSFPKIVITQIMFWGLLGLVVVMEFMLVGMIKSKRPNLISA